MLEKFVIISSMSVDSTIEKKYISETNKICPYVDSSPDLDKILYWSMSVDSFLDSDKILYWNMSVDSSLDLDKILYWNMSVDSSLT